MNSGFSIANCETGVHASGMRRRPGVRVCVFERPLVGVWRLTGRGGEEKGGKLFGPKQECWGWVHKHVKYLGMYVGRYDTRTEGDL